MDGAIAPLDEIAALAQRFDALLLVDDCHATGIIGEGGRGSGAFRGVADKVDILTGTYGKALGGAMGGFVAARQPVIDLLRQRARWCIPFAVCGRRSLLWIPGPLVGIARPGPPVSVPGLGSQLSSCERPPCMLMTSIRFSSLASAADTDGCAKEPRPPTTAPVPSARLPRNERRATVCSAE